MTDLGHVVDFRSSLWRSRHNDRNRCSGDQEHHGRVTVTELCQLSREYDRKQPAFSGPKSLKMIHFSLWPGFVPAIQVFGLSEVKAVHDELRY